MTRNSRMPESKVLVTALFVSLLLLGTLHAQTGVPAYKGRFTLAQPIQWNTSVLQPGDYTITIESLSPFMYFRSSVRTCFPLQFDLIVINGGTDKIS